MAWLWRLTPERFLPVDLGGGASVEASFHTLNSPVVFLRLEFMINPYATPMPSEFEIGIAEIDAQHGQLYSLLDRLRQSIDKKYGYAVNAILAELDIEMRIHFSVEESLMQLLSFPEAAAHVSEHRQLAKHLAQFRERAEDHDISDDLASFIKTWLTDHIDKFDRQFVAHFLSHGVDAGGANTAD